VKDSDPALDDTVTAAVANGGDQLAVTRDASANGGAVDADKSGANAVHEN
jgi:hypothetical protein